MLQGAYVMHTFSTTHLTHTRAAVLLPLHLSDVAMGRVRVFVVFAANVPAGHSRRYVCRSMTVWGGRERDGSGMGRDVGWDVMCRHDKTGGGDIGVHGMSVVGISGRMWVRAW